MDMIEHFHDPAFQYLSNFWELRSPYYVRLKNPSTGLSLAYRTSEHAFQAAKTIYDSERLTIQKAAFPGIAKKMGSKDGYKDFQINLRPDWEAIKLDVMLAIVRKKFQDPDLAERLLLTGNEDLQEGNWWGDEFWGVVIARGGKPCEPYGQNHLGKILMQVRSELKRSQGAT